LAVYQAKQMAHAYANELIFLQDQQDTLFHIGYLSMLAKNGKTIGYLNINFTNYSLRDIGDGDFVLAKIDSIPQIACHFPYVDSSDVVGKPCFHRKRSFCFYSM
jgi:hypothetical protein